jgi:outer membrane protein
MVPRGLFLAVAAFLLPLGLSAQGLTKTKVGLCDVQRIREVYFKDSKAARDLEDFRNQYTKETAQINAEITDLDNQRMDADRAGNRDQALKLEKQVTAKKAYLDQYKQVKNQKYKQLYEDAQSSTFVKEMADAIRRVAEAEGFALILRLNNFDAVVFYTQEIDLTDKVIKSLRDAQATGSATGR